MRRMRWAGESVTKRSGAIADGRMLQRPPPLMRIFRPPSAVRSISTTEAPADAAAMAATSPAAPAPITATDRPAADDVDATDDGGAADDTDDADWKRPITDYRLPTTRLRQGYGGQAESDCLHH